jgi:hypothetical protein
MIGPRIATVLAVVAGLAVWVSIALLGGGVRNGVFVVREAWDTPAYFSIGLPMLAVAGGVAGFLAPRRVWRWPLWIAVGHTLGVALVHPTGTSLGLIPLALVFAGLPLVILLLVPTIVGGIIRRGGWDRGLLV